MERLFKRNLKIPNGYRLLRLGEIKPANCLYYWEYSLLKNLRMTYIWKKGTNIKNNFRIGEHSFPLIIKKNPNISDL